MFCGIDTRDVDKPDYPERAAAELARCYRRGARGTGELTDKGTGFGGKLHPDDPRLDAFWNKCAELKIPANIHIADHPSAWKPLDVYQERSHAGLSALQSVRQGRALVGRIDRDARSTVGAKHPKTRFIACHLGNQGHDWRRWPRPSTATRIYTSISAARDYEVGREPRTAGRFLARYRNRVLFGTDMGREKSMYQAWWRLFESADEFDAGAQSWWRYYGLELPAPCWKASIAAMPGKC